MKPLDPVVERLIEDQKHRETKKIQVVEQNKKKEEDSVYKSSQGLVNPRPFD